MEREILYHPSPLIIRYELLPIMKFFGPDIEFLPSDTPIAITTTETGAPNNPNGRTIKRVKYANDAGLTDNVPHVSARSMRSNMQATANLIELNELGVSEIFLVGGDTDFKTGLPFPDGYSLLRKIADMRQRGLLDNLQTIGFPSYPHGHHNSAITDNMLWKDLKAKQDLAIEAGLDPYIETQFDGNAQHLRHWMSIHKDHGLHMPAQIGVLGAVTREKAWQVMKLNGGAIEAFKFSLKSHLPLWRFLLGTHVNHSIDTVRTIIDETQGYTLADEPGKRIYIPTRGVTVNAIGAGEESYKAYNGKF